MRFILWRTPVLPLATQMSRPKETLQRRQQPCQQRQQQPRQLLATMLGWVLLVLQAALALARTARWSAWIVAHTLRARLAGRAPWCLDPPKTPRHVGVSLQLRPDALATAATRLRILRLVLCQCANAEEFGREARRSREACAWPSIVGWACSARPCAGGAQRRPTPKHSPNDVRRRATTKSERRRPYAAPSSDARRVLRPGVHARDPVRRERAACGLRPRP